MPLDEKDYPEGPPEYGETPSKSQIPPGQGMNVQAPVAQTYLDFTTPIGRGSGVFFGLMFQFPKWGMDRWKIDEYVEVSPVFQQYYQLTIAQKQQMETQIKQGLASVASAFSDFDLVAHDFRKYREFMDYFTMIEKGNKMMKEAKGGDKSKGEELRNRGEQTLRAIFIDQVDVHTGEGIALKLIAPRWPTIIADFMKLDDGDLDASKMKSKLEVSEAEAVVLKTKNVLYLEWRDKLFKETVKNRFENLSKLYNARMKSIREYQNMVKPLLARYKMISEGLQNAETRKFLRKASFWRPDAQAISTEFVRIWAWKPFSPSDKYKVSKEFYDEVSLEQAGFTAEEAEWLRNTPKEEGGYGKDTVDGLPIEPSIDMIVRRIAKRIEEVYKINLTPLDFINARNIILNRYKTSKNATESYETWPWSPYFVFADVPIYRPTIRLPNGEELENFFVNDLKVAVNTQNIIIGRCLELIARDKEMENYIEQMLGEMGVQGETLAEFRKAQEWKTESEKKTGKDEKEEGSKWDKKKPLLGFGSVWEAKQNLSKAGLDIGFVRAVGPYEFAHRDIFTKIPVRDASTTFRNIAIYLKSGFGVPGVQQFY